MVPEDGKKQLGMSLGQALEQYRVEHHLKQKDLADKLHIDERTLRRWINGQIPQQVEELKRIADTLSLDPGTWWRHCQWRQTGYRGDHLMLSNH